MIALVLQIEVRLFSTTDLCGMCHTEGNAAWPVMSCLLLDVLCTDVSSVFKMHAQLKVCFVLFSC